MSRKIEARLAMFSGGAYGDTGWVMKNWYGLIMTTRELYLFYYLNDYEPLQSVSNIYHMGKSGFNFNYRYVTKRAG